MANKLHIKKGDQVVVISGEYKDKKGKVLSVDRNLAKALVEGINLVSRHTKPNAKNPDGGIVKKEAPMHVSKLMLLKTKEAEAPKKAVKATKTTKAPAKKKAKVAKEKA